MRAAFALPAAAFFVIAAGGEGCAPKTPPPAPRQRTAQAEAAQRAAESVSFSANAEIENVRRRLEITSDPNLLGYIVLLNEAGQPILYEGVRGKVTSGGKRLTPQNEVRTVSTLGNNGGQHSVVVAAPSDEGTHGSSNPYIFYWSTGGEYRQWTGHYLYSTQPIRLRVEPLVIGQAPPSPPPDQGARTSAPTNMNGNR